MEWQPIATAPKDGEAFLAWGPYGHHTVFYDRPDADGSGIKAVNPPTFFGNEEWCWSIPDGGALHEGSFTHWMPLPTPPA